MSDFLSELKRHAKGELRSDPISRRAYSVDASIYEVEPLAILQPIDNEDVATALAIAAKHNIPLTARGAATGITGGCLGSGLILDLSRHMNQIVSINLEEQYAICQPGVIQDDLNRALAPHGYRLGPDTSTGDRATLGGMLANNAAGARSLRYGSMVDHILEVALATEQKLPTVLRKLDAIRLKYGEEIAAHFPKLPRRVSGYNLDALLEQPFNLGKLIAGSEGTLAIVTEMKLRIVPNFKRSVLCLIPFDTILAAMREVEGLLAYNPLSLEMIDSKIISLGRSRHRLSWLKGTPEALLIVEFEGETAPALGTILTDPKTIAQVWELRKAGLGLLLSRRTYSRAVAFIEDLSVPPHNLAPFMEQFLALLSSKGKEAGIYGHVGAGCLHIRPYFDLRDASELKRMREMMIEVCDLVLAHGGVLSGEHGDGLVRSWLNKRLHGKTLYAAFEEVKKAFDPDNRLNPGKIVHGPPPEENLRFTPIKPWPTFLDFKAEGGIELAADLCNGNGLCRKRDKVMCPSFQVTQDEYDTTRARAQALRGLIHGQLTTKDWDGIYQVLDLCIECKGCKAECPSQVDMAKMKAEFLFQYQEKKGYSLRSRLFGHLSRFYSWASPFATAVNALSGTRFAKWLMRSVGMTDKRPLPLLTTQRFSDWWHKHVSPPSVKTVVLFNDTYTEFLEPQIGIAAVKVLESMGYQVIVPLWQCCGRPLISKGLLKPARAQSEKLLASLMPYAKQGHKIVGLEPSCLSALVDDFAGLCDNRLLAPACCTFDAFVAAEKPQFKKLAKPILVHGHCHQKALVGMKETLEVLRSIPGATVEEIPSGCCGMAGSFGYEKEHYEFSLKIGELTLLPAVRASAAETMIVANGLSCRTQIAQATGRKPLHLAELLAEII